MNILGRSGLVVALGLLGFLFPPAFVLAFLIAISIFGDLTHKNTEITKQSNEGNEELARLLKIVQDKKNQSPSETANKSSEIMKKKLGAAFEPAQVPVEEIYTERFPPPITEAEYNKSVSQIRKSAKPRFSAEKERIKNHCESIGLSRIVHFTQASNLPSILSLIHI